MASVQHVSGKDRPFSSLSLQREGLAKLVTDDEVEFAGQVGGLYMLFLAKQMAKQRPIVSDNPTFEALTYAPPEFSAAPDGTADNGLVLATAVFSSAVPVDIESVPMPDLIKFRTDFEGERVSFYDGITKLTTELAAINDPKLVRQAIEHHSNAIKNKVASLDKKLRLLNLTSGRGIFSVSLPASVTGAAWGLGVTNPFALAAVGGLVVASLLISRNFEKQLVQAESTVAYIL